jgi:hypothetical protein
VFFLSKKKLDVDSVRWLVKIFVILPKVQVQAPQFKVHIFFTKMQKGRKNKDGLSESMNGAKDSISSRTAQVTIQGGFMTNKSIS